MGSGPAALSFLRSGGLLQAVSDGFADAGHLGNGAEDDGGTGLIKRSQSSEKASGEHIAIVPWAPGKDVICCTAVPALRQHDPCLASCRGRLIDGCDQREFSRSSVLCRYIDQHEPGLRGVVAKAKARCGECRGVGRRLIRRPVELGVIDYDFEQADVNGTRPVDTHSLVCDLRDRGF